MAKKPQPENSLSSFFNSFLKFLKSDFSFKKHLPVYIFTGLIVFILYYYNFDSWKKSLELSVFQNTLFLFICYAISFFIPLLVVMKSVRQKISLKGIWISVLFISLFAFSSSWSPYYTFSVFRESEYYYWFRRILNNGTPFLIFIIVFTLVWKKYFSDTGKFMWVRTDVLWWKIIYPLLIVVVLIVFAGSQMGDFGSEYPVFQIKKTAGTGLLPQLQMLSFEAAYALDFYVIELIFRGVLVLGLIRYFGNNVLLPMATLYMFIHYGKPMAETISSFFGAYVLGYLAIYTRSVLPGTVLHVTLAWTMEAVGALILVSQ